MGLRPRNDAKIELDPIDIGWDHFTANNIRYRDTRPDGGVGRAGRRVVHYGGVPEGYSVFLDGQRAFTVDRLARWSTTRPPAASTPTAATVLHARRVGDVKAPTQVRQSRRAAGRPVRQGGRRPHRRRPAEPGARRDRLGLAAAGGAGAVDGSTINEPYWSSRGSPNAPTRTRSTSARPTRVDDVRLYFYRDRTADGHASRPATGSSTTTGRVGGRAAAGAHPGDPAGQLQPRPVLRRHGTAAAGVDDPPGGAPHRPEGVPRCSAPAYPARPNRNVAPYVLASRTWRSGGRRRPGSSAWSRTTPSRAGRSTAQWSMVSGPGTAIFADPGAAAPVATFTAPGEYTLRLTATDGAATRRVHGDRHGGSDPGRVQRRPPGHALAPRTPRRGERRRGQRRDRPVRIQRHGQPRWGTWPQQGEQWAQLEWASPQGRVNASDMYFFDDGGGVRVPASLEDPVLGRRGVPRPRRCECVRAGAEPLQPDHVPPA